MRPSSRRSLRRLAAVACALLLAMQMAFANTAVSAPAASAPAVSVPVLCYHRFGPTVTDSMTVKTSTFETQLKYLRDNGYTVIPLQRLVDYELGKAPPPPQKSVVITMDDGHRSVYEQALPLIEKYRVPVTLFIYPSAISNPHAPYAMTWEELHKLVATGLFSIQSHTYWHPNFKKEKRRLSPAAYDKFVTHQLKASKAVLEKRFGTDIDILAWPFGIYNDDLLAQAQAAGYVAAFSIDGRPAHSGDRPLALPRFLMIDADNGKRFARMLAPPHRTPVQEATARHSAIPRTNAHTVTAQR